MLVVLLTIDCGRADHLDGRSGLTPNLDSLRAEGASFTQAFSQSQNTLSSHVSLLTSNYLFQHGIYSNFERCELPGHSLSRRLVERGFRAQALMGVNFLASILGDQIGPVDERYSHSKQGLVERLLSRFGSRTLRRPFDDTVSCALRWLDSEPGPDRFLMLHAFDAHMVYEAPPALLGEHVKDGRARTSCQAQLEELGWSYAPFRELKRRVPVEHFPARYRAAIQHIDSCLGTLVKGLRERGLWEDTMLVLTADHGECLAGEHGLYCMHKKLFDETVHVPLWIRFPGGAHSGVAVDSLVELVDVAPTIARVAGFEEPLFMGRDLGEIAAGTAPGRDVVFSEHVDNLLRSVRDREHIWVEKVPSGENRYGFELETEELFRRDGAPAAEGTSREHLEAAARQLMNSRPEVSQAWLGHGAVDDRIASQLQRLGYL